MTAVQSANCALHLADQNETTVEEVYSKAVDVKIADQDRRGQFRIVECLTALGWVQKGRPRVAVDGVEKRVRLTVTEIVYSPSPSRVIFPRP